MDSNWQEFKGNGRHFYFERGKTTELRRMKKRLCAKECWRWEINSYRPPSKVCGRKCLCHSFFCLFPTWADALSPIFFLPYSHAVLPTGVGWKAGQNSQGQKAKAQWNWSEPALSWWVLLYESGPHKYGEKQGTESTAGQLHFMVRAVWEERQNAQVNVFFFREEPGWNQFTCSIQIFLVSNVCREELAAVKKWLNNSFLPREQNVSFLKIVQTISFRSKWGQT